MLSRSLYAAAADARMTPDEFPRSEWSTERTFCNRGSRSVVFVAVLCPAQKNGAAGATCQTVGGRCRSIPAGSPPHTTRQLQQCQHMLTSGTSACTWLPPPASIAAHAASALARCPRKMHVSKHTSVRPASSCCGAAGMPAESEVRAEVEACVGGNAPQLSKAEMLRPTQPARTALLPLVSAELSDSASASGCMFNGKQAYHCQIACDAARPSSTVAPAALPLAALLQAWCWSAWTSCFSCSWLLLQQLPEQCVGFLPASCRSWPSRCRVTAVDRCRPPAELLRSNRWWLQPVACALALTMPTTRAAC